MSITGPDDNAQCREARDALQLRLDDELAPERSALLDQHLSGCDACRAHSSRLQATRNAFRSMPVPTLPAGMLDGVRAPTKDEVVRAAPRFRDLVFRWQRVAVAATLAMALCGTWMIVREQNGLPSDAELARAASDFELVVSLTGSALARVEHVAFDGVLAGRVVPAVESIPEQWRKATEFAAASDAPNE